MLSCLSSPNTARSKAKQDWKVPTLTASSLPAQAPLSMRELPMSMTPRMRSALAWSSASKAWCFWCLLCKDKASTVRHCTKGPCIVLMGWGGISFVHRLSWRSSLWVGDLLLAPVVTLVTWVTTKFWADKTVAELIHRTLAVCSAFHRCQCKIPCTELSC